MSARKAERDQLQIGRQVLAPRKARSGLEGDPTGTATPSFEIWTDEEEARATGLLQILDEEGRGRPRPCPPPGPGGAAAHVPRHVAQPPARPAPAAPAAPGPNRFSHRRHRAGGGPHRRRPRHRGRGLVRARPARGGRRSVPRLPAAHLPGPGVRQRERPHPRPADALPLRLARQPPHHHVLLRVQPAAPRHRHGHGRAHPRRPGGRARLLRRRRHQHRGLPRRPQLRGRVQGPGGVRLPEQPVGHLHPDRAADLGRDPGAQGAELRLAGRARRRQRRLRLLPGDQGGGGPGPRRRRPLASSRR